jgi:hypothetical protein
MEKFACGEQLMARRYLPVVMKVTGIGSDRLPSALMALPWLAAVKTRLFGYGRSTMRTTL